MIVITVVYYYQRGSMKHRLLPTLVLFFCCINVTADASLVWTGVSPGDDGYSDVPWLGRVYDSGGGWIWHDSLGWLYAQGSTPASVYFYKPGLGWLWSGSSSAHTFYSWDIGGWIYHAPGTADPQWFYDYSGSRWVADYMDGTAVTDVSALLSALPAKHNVPAVAVSMTLHGRIVAHGWAGVRYKGHSGDVGPSSKWEVASCSKSVACTIAAELVAEGKLHWDDKLPALLPGMTLNAGWANVTLFDLLHHTSGIDNDTVYTYFNPYTAAGDTKTAQRRTMTAAVLSRPPALTPQTTYKYCGVAYTIAGYIMELKAGVSYETLVNTRIFGKLGLSSGGYLMPATPVADRLTQPWGHRDGRPVDPSVQENELPAIMVPCGGLNMTVDDLARYAAAHCAGELGLCTELDQTMWHTLHYTGSTANPTYFYGWFPASFSEIAALGPGAICHTGNNGNFSTLMIVAPSTGITVVAVCNEGSTTCSDPAIHEAIAIILASQGFAAGK